MSTKNIVCDHFYVNNNEAIFGYMPQQALNIPELPYKDDFWLFQNIVLKSVMVSFVVVNLKKANTKPQINLQCYNIFIKPCYTFIYIDETCSLKKTEE